MQKNPSNPRICSHDLLHEYVRKIMQTKKNTLLTKKMTFTCTHARFLPFYILQSNFLIHDFKVIMPVFVK